MVSGVVDGGGTFRSVFLKREACVVDRGTDGRILVGIRR